jgi:hypothetical protein
VKCLKLFKVTQNLIHALTKYSSKLLSGIQRFFRLKLHRIRRGHYATPLIMLGNSSKNIQPQWQKKKKTSTINNLCSFVNYQWSKYIIVWIIILFPFYPLEKSKKKKVKYTSKSLTRDSERWRVLEWFLNNFFFVEFWSLLKKIITILWKCINCVGCQGIARKLQVSVIRILRIAKREQKLIIVMDFLNFLFCNNFSRQEWQ